MPIRPIVVVVGFIADERLYRSLQDSQLVLSCGICLKLPVLLCLDIDILLEAVQLGRLDGLFLLLVSR